MSLRGFKFSLETPLKVKKIHRTQLESELAAAINNMNAQKMVLEQLEDENAQLRSKMKTLISEGIKARDLKEKNLYLKFLAEQISYHQLEYQRVLDIYQKLQSALIKLLNEIDMLEKLKDKQFKEHLKEIEKQEEKALEERINYKSSIQGGRMYG